MISFEITVLRLLKIKYEKAANLKRHVLVFQFSAIASSQLVMKRNSSAASKRKNIKSLICNKLSVVIHHSY